MFNELNKAHQKYRQEKLDQIAEYERISKDRLSRAIETKIRTTFIGALDSIEREFGRQWGFGKSTECLTEKEHTFRLAWQSLREEILNKGNAQLRAAKLELNEYSVRWNRKQYNFTIGDGNE